MFGSYKYILLLAFSISCSDAVQITNQLNEKPDIYPDYTDVTIPANIAPLNFSLVAPVEDARAILSSGNLKVEVKLKDNQFVIPPSKWSKLLQSAEGNKVVVVVQTKEKGQWNAFAPFTLFIAEESVDPYIAYRLIAPGYSLWNHMGIYQRELESYTETAILENKMSGRNCVNCHSFCMQDPDKMLFHMRETYPGTILVDGDKIEKLNTKTDQTVSSLVYPSWHHSGKYVAFSVNKTKQGFHMNDKNRIEVFDETSDVVVYDVKKHEIVTSANLFSKASFETFPTFSPDGKTLFFCTAKARPIPQEYSEIKYNLCSISFDPENRSFGSVVDTLYNVETSGKSASFPRVSPDGKFLVYTLSGYGNFSIWHKDADLYMVNLTTGESRPMDELNSDDVESYHSWSSNSRWLIFSSRRMDGLYTRPYIAYIDENGKTAKPFLLPQEDTGFYDRFMMSYNIPEFITGKVKVSGRVLGLKAKEEKGIDVKFVK